jgi:hypothetical protein
MLHQNPLSGPITLSFNANGLLGIVAYILSAPRDKTNIGPNLFHQNRTVSWLILDPALRQRVFDIPKRKREACVQHHSQSYDLGVRLEIAKRAAFCHPEKLGSPPCPAHNSFL